MPLEGVLGGWQSLMASKICAAVGEAKILPETEAERKEGATKPENIGSLSVSQHTSKAKQKSWVLETYCPPPAKPIVVT